MTIFFHFSPTSNYLHPLQVENCDSNSRLVADEDDNGKFRLERPMSAMSAPLRVDVTMGMAGYRQQSMT